MGGGHKQGAPAGGGSRRWGKKRRGGARVRVPRLLSPHNAPPPPLRGASTNHKDRNSKQIEHPKRQSKDKNSKDGETHARAQGRGKEAPSLRPARKTRGRGPSASLARSRAQTLPCAQAPRGGDCSACGEGAGGWGKKGRGHTRKSNEGVVFFGKKIGGVVVSRATNRGAMLCGMALVEQEKKLRVVLSRKKRGWNVFRISRIKKRDRKSDDRTARWLNGWGGTAWWCFDEDRSVRVDGSATKRKKAHVKKRRGRASAEVVGAHPPAPRPPAPPRPPSTRAKVSVGGGGRGEGRRPGGVCVRGAAQRAASRKKRGLMFLWWCGGGVCVCAPFLKEDGVCVWWQAAPPRRRAGAGPRDGKRGGRRDRSTPPSS